MDLEKLPIIGIMRGITEDKLIKTIEAAIRGGLKFVEITMNTDFAADLIKKAREEFKEKVLIGAGTVITVDELNMAVDSGAQFIVAPNFNSIIAEICTKNELPYFPGAITPQEIFNAWQAGVYMVKVFPVSAMGGPVYIKELRGPYQKIKLLACGGVNPENIREYFQSGINAIAIGSQIFNPEWMKYGFFDKIEAAAGMFVDCVKQAIQ